MSCQAARQRIILDIQLFSDLIKGTWCTVPKFTDDSRIGKSASCEDTKSLQKGCRQAKHEDKKLTHDDHPLWKAEQKHKIFKQNEKQRKS